MYLSEEGKAYRRVVHLSCGTHVGLTGRISIVIYATPKDKRKRDLDNLCKSSLDALQAAGWYKDDSQIDQLTIIRLKSNKTDPHLWVHMTEMATDGDTGDEPQSSG